MSKELLIYNSYCMLYIINRVIMLVTNDFIPQICN